MTHTKMKFLPFSVIAASVVAALLIDASAYAAEGRVRRGGAPTPVVTAPQSAPAPGSVSAAPTVCYETEVLPASAPAVTPVDEGRRRGRASTQSAPVQSSQPIVITRIVPCPTETSSGPLTTPPGSYTPGLLGPTLVASGPLPGELETPPSLTQQVPEPSVLALFGIGALGFAVARRRRRRA